MMTKYNKECIELNLECDIFNFNTTIINNAKISNKGIYALDGFNQIKPIHETIELSKISMICLRIGDPRVQSRWQCSSSEEIQLKQGIREMTSGMQMLQMKQGIGEMTSGMQMLQITGDKMLKIIEDELK